MSQDKYLRIEADGYPGQTETLNTLNDASQQGFTNIAALCGSNTIVKGCNDVLRNGIAYVTDGIVCIDGKIYQFKESMKSGGVVVITETFNDIYDMGDGSANMVLPVRGFSYATSAALNSINVPWSSFVRLDDVKMLTQKTNVMYENRVLFKGHLKHLFQDTILKMVTPQKITFPTPLDNTNYKVQLSVELLKEDGGTVSAGPIMVSSFEHEMDGFKVYAGRAHTGGNASFNIHYIIYK